MGPFTGDPGVSGSLFGDISSAKGTTTVTGRDELSPASAFELSAAAGAVTAVALWSSYCWKTFGVAWPNTKYAKAAALDFEGVAYVIETVLPRQPWLVALTGLFLIGRLILNEQRRSTPSFNSALLFGWCATIVMIAVSRPLHVGVDFFEWRYFAPFAWIPYVLLCVSLGDSRPRGLIVWMTPIAAATAVLLLTTHGRQRRQEHNVAALHTAPAQWISRCASIVFGVRRMPSKSIFRPAD